jgi:hypothetical protein
MASLIGTIKIAIMTGLFLVAGLFLFNPVAAIPFSDTLTTNNHRQSQDTAGFPLGNDQAKGGQYHRFPFDEREGQTV